MSRGRSPRVREAWSSGVVQDVQYSLQPLKGGEGEGGGGEGGEEGGGGEGWEEWWWWWWWRE